MTDSAVAGEQGQQLLVTVHNHLRDELEQLRQLIRDVRHGATGPAEARSYLNTMAMRQNYWTIWCFRHRVKLLLSPTVNGRRRPQGTG